MKININRLTVVILIAVFSTITYAENTIFEISTLESSQQVVHKSDFGGKILEINAKNGQLISKDDVVMILKNKEIKMAYENSKNKYEIAMLSYEKIKKLAEDQQLLKLANAKRAVITAKMNLQKAKNGTKAEELDKLKLNVETTRVNYETAKANFDKNEILYNKKSIAEQSFLQIKAGFESAHNTYESAQKALSLAEKGADIEDISSMEAILEEAKSNYNFIQKTVDEKIWMYDIQLAEISMNTAKESFELAKEKYKNLQVKSELTGIIADLNIDEKNKISSKQNLFTVLNIDEMILKVGIGEKYISDFEDKAKIEIFIPSLNETFKGEVESINPIADNKTKKFEAKIKVSNKDHLLKQGMHGEVSIVL